MELEQRIAFDAAGAAGIDDMSDDREMRSDVSDEAEGGGQGYGQGQESALGDAMEKIYEELAASDAKKEILFIDSAVQDIDSLIANIEGDYEIVRLDPGMDGVEQIASFLADRKDIEAVHIISHGAAGELRLGTSALTMETMTGEYADELAIIGGALSDDADILIYGCDFSAGAEGKRASRILAEMTGADIASSIDDTGAAKYGGDWDLETKAGLIEARTITAEGWDSVLAQSAPVLRIGDGSSSSAADNPNLVANGSFESGTSNWTSNSSPEAGPASTYGVSAQDGSRVAEVEGVNATTPDPSYLQQTVDTVAGQQYTLTWYGHSRVSSHSDNAQDKGFLSIDGQQVTDFTTERDGWTLYSYTFTASSVTTTIRFTSDGSTGPETRKNGSGGDTWGLVLDDVRMVRNGYETTFTENGSTVNIAGSSTSITDAGDTNMESAKITLTNAKAGDYFSWPDTLPGGITASQNGNTLTLTGTASSTDYAQAIRSIKFGNSSEAPSTEDRVITITVNDGEHNSQPAASTVKVDDAPVLADQPGTLYVENILSRTYQPPGDIGEQAVSDSPFYIDNSARTSEDPYESSLISRSIGMIDANTSHDTFWYTANNADILRERASASSSTALLFSAGVSSRISFWPAGDYAEAINGKAGGASAADKDTAKTFNPIREEGGAEGDGFENITAVSKPRIVAVGGTATGNGAATGGIPIIAGGPPVAVSNGMVSLAADGQTLTFTPAADYNGDTGFAYTVETDGVSESANISIQVKSVAGAPRITVQSRDSTDDSN